jgi:hypothetical protein
MNSNKTVIKFQKNPKALSWTSNDGEKIIFEEQYCLGPCKLLMVDALITAEFTGQLVFPAYNVYKLYVNNILVCQSGCESLADSSTINLDSCTLLWGGNPSGCNKYANTVKVTAQLIQPDGSDPIYSNITNSLGNFQGAKGAFIRIVSM